MNRGPLSPSPMPLPPPVEEWPGRPWPPVQVRAWLGWRWMAAVVFLAFGIVGLASGVSLSERPDVGESGLLVMI